MLDVFHLPAGTGDLWLRVTRLAPRRPSDEALRARALHELVWGIDRGDPAYVGVVGQVIDLLDGGSTGASRWGGALPEATRMAQLRTLEEALVSGRLQIQWEDFPSLTARTAWEPELPPLPPAEPARESKSFDVKLIDDTGAPIAGMDVNLTIDGEPETFTTSGGGLAHGEGYESSALLRMLKVDDVPKKLESRWSKPRSLELPKGADVAEVVAGERFNPLRVSANKPFTLILRRPAVRRVRLLGMLFDANKCFLLPQGLAGILSIVAQHRERPAAKVLIVGHAGGDEDLKGADIAVDRADLVAAYLTGKPEPWLAWFKKDKPERSRWGTREVQLMLSAVPGNFYSGYASGLTDVPTRQAIKDFQSSQGLEPDGKASGATLKALVKAYLDIEDTSVAQDVVPITHGCEGHFEDDKTADGLEPDDRRLEVFFFDGEMSPAPGGKVSQAGAPQYAAWRSALVSTRDFEHHGIHVQIIDAKKRPVPFAEVHLDGPTTGDAVADVHGFVSFAGLKPGEYTLNAQKKGLKVGSYNVTYPTAKTTLGYKKPRSKPKAPQAAGAPPSLPAPPPLGDSSPPGLGGGS